MKIKLVSIFGLITFITSTIYIPEATAQQTANPEPVSSISKGLGFFVFPSNNQTQEQIDADELECYKWAIAQTNYDPLNPTKVVAQDADTSLDGSAVAGAAKGATAGAAFGAIAGDTGKGAAIGAVAGGLRGRRARKYRQKCFYLI